MRLCDVLEDGRARLLNFGALKASHRQSHESPAALVPGETYDFEIEIWATANLFKKGQRIRVDVSASDFPFFEVNPLPSNASIRLGEGSNSRLVLPVVKARSALVVSDSQRP